MQQIAEIQSPSKAIYKKNRQERKRGQGKPFNPVGKLIKKGNPRQYPDRVRQPDGSVKVEFISVTRRQRRQKRGSKLLTTSVKYKRKGRGPSLSDRLKEADDAKVPISKLGSRWGIREKPNPPKKKPPVSKHLPVGLHDPLYPPSSTNHERNKIRAERRKENLETERQRKAGNGVQKER